MLMKKTKKPRVWLNIGLRSQWWAIRGLGLGLLALAVGCPDADSAKNRFIGTTVTEQQFAGTNFYETISNTKNLVVVDFTADWCGPCQSLKPILKEMAGKGEFDLVMIDADQHASVLDAFRVNGIPHLLFIRDGRILDVHRGGASKRDIESIVRAL